ncbi:MAG: hypothetical protein ACI4TM_07190 [Candidatus Cryptobacteroides sp.]
MKRSLAYILAAAVSTAAMISCIKEQPIADGNAGTGIRVKLVMPEIEVKSGTSIPEIFAYVPSQIQAGEVLPTGCTVQTSDGTLLYNLPEGTTEVIFTNINPESEGIELKGDDEGNITFALKGSDASPLNIGTEILYGRLDGITCGMAQTYTVPMKRLSSKMTNFFHIIDSEGNKMSTESIELLTICYSSLGFSVTMLPDGTAVYKPEEEYHGIGSSVGSNGESYVTSFLPSSEIPTAKIEVTMTNGTKKTYEKNLGQVLQSNRHYTITYRMKYLNASADFILEDPSISYDSGTPSISKEEFFKISSETMIGRQANDSVDVEVSTVLPYAWTAEMISGEENFTFKTTDKGFVVKALYDNESDLRTAKVFLSTEEGFTKTFTFRQKAAPQKIVMKSQHTSSSGTIYVSGIGITVKDPNDTEAREFSGELNDFRITIDGLSNGAEVTIEGEIITGFRGVGNSYNIITDELGDKYNSDGTNKGYYFEDSYYDQYEYTFTNCIYLEDLCIGTDQTNVDVSEMKSLRRLYLGYSGFETLTFGENQPIESFTAYNCDKVAGFDFSKIASTVKKINLYDNDGMTGAMMVNCPELKYINVNDCSNMGVINLSGCSAIENLRIYNNSAKTLNITNCSGLKTLELNNITLTSFINDGVDNIEEVRTSGVTINKFDFSGRTALKSVGMMSCPDFSVNGCTNLETVGQISNAAALDFTGCGNLKSVVIGFNSSATQSIAFQNSGIESFHSSYANMNIDFSQLTELKTLNFLGCCANVTELDLSSNEKLESLYLTGNNYNTNDKTLQSLSFPKSLKKIDIHTIYYFRGTLDLSDCKELEELDITYVGSGYYNYSIDYNTYFDLLDLSGCSKLKTINKNEDNNSSNYAYCDRLKAIDLSGCTSLEECYMRSAAISKFDFSDCQNLFKIDVGNNSLDAEAINNMIDTMPDRSSDYITGSYSVSGNSGADTHDESAANAKGWYKK